MSKTITRRSFSEALPLDLSHLPPLLQRIYTARGVTSRSQLEHGLDRLLPYHDLLDIDKAVACLFEAISYQKNILIVGDFDVDGATSTAVAIRVLRSFGAKHVNFLVPNRFAFGYGLTPELVVVAIEQFNPDLIITVDNGISSHAGIATARDAGIKVIVTDHHLAGDTLPLADAIVNPNQPNDPFRSKSIAGVGVIFYVCLALRRFLVDRNWFVEQSIPEPNMSHVLDLVALGTVADVVALDHNNRIMVSIGLRRIRAGQCAPGIIALLDIANRNPVSLVAADLGFAVAPRLNAAGRLDDMSLGIECLLSDDISAARVMSKTLDQLNSDRRVIEADMQVDALRFLKKLQLDDKALPMGICLFNEEWHQGVIGILASRIKERFNRPAIIFAPSSVTEIKGSARSISRVHIRDVLADIATQYPNMMGKFGGHAMAAGLTLPRAAFPDFQAAFNEVLSRFLSEEDLNPVLFSDGELHLAELTLETAELLRASGPWGQAFPEPAFDGHFKIAEQRLLAEKHLKMVLLSDHNTLIEAIAFNVDLKQWPNHRCETVHLVYRLDVNHFRDRKKVQLIVEHLEAISFS